MLKHEINQHTRRVGLTADARRMGIDPSLVLHTKPANVTDRDIDNMMSQMAIGHVEDIESLFGAMFTNAEVGATS